MTTRKEAQAGGLSTLELQHIHELTWARTRNVTERQIAATAAAARTGALIGLARTLSGERNPDGAATATAIARVELARDVDALEEKPSEWTRPASEAIREAIDQLRAAPDFGGSPRAEDQYRTKAILLSAECVELGQRAIDLSNTGMQDAAKQCAIVAREMDFHAIGYANWAMMAAEAGGRRTNAKRRITAQMSGLERQRDAIIQRNTRIIRRNAPVLRSRLLQLMDWEGDRQQAEKLIDAMRTTPRPAVMDTIGMRSQGSQGENRDIDVTLYEEDGVIHVKRALEAYPSGYPKGKAILIYDATRIGHERNVSQMPPALRETLRSRINETVRKIHY